MLKQSKLRKKLAWFLTMSFLFSLSVTTYSGDDLKAPVKVTNRTDHKLDITINETVHRDVQPNTVIRTEVRTDNVTIRATYSAGQQVRGNYIRSFKAFDRDTKTSNSCSGRDRRSGEGPSCTQSTQPVSPERRPLSVDVQIYPADMR